MILERSVKIKMHKIIYLDNTEPVEYYGGTCVNQRDVIRLNDNLYRVIRIINPKCGMSTIEVSLHRKITSDK
jgi:hypothetical protein